MKQLMRRITPFLQEAQGVGKIKDPQPLHGEEFSDRGKKINSGVQELMCFTHFGTTE